MQTFLKRTVLLLSVSLLSIGLALHSVEDETEATHNGLELLRFLPVTSENGTNNTVLTCRWHTGPCFGSGGTNGIALDFDHPIEYNDVWFRAWGWYDVYETMNFDAWIYRYYPSQTGACHETGADIFRDYSEFVAAEVYKHVEGLYHDVGFNLHFSDPGTLNLFQVGNMVSESDPDCPITGDHVHDEQYDATSTHTFERNLAWGSRTVNQQYALYADENWVRRIIY